MNKTNIYFHEGETEENLINSLKAKKKLPHGKTKKVNLWNETRVNRIIRQLSRNTVIYIIFDTDTTDNIDRFTDNIKQISKFANKVFLLPQSSNFEDEIAYCCNKTIRVLPKFIFGPKCDSITKFKKKIISEKELLTKLESKNYSFSKMWIRFEIKRNMSFKKKNILWGLK